MSYSCGYFIHEDDTLYQAQVNKVDLVGDGGYRGAVIQIYKNMSAVTVEGTEITVQAGALLSSVAAAAKNAALTGFEFAGGIP